MSFSGLSFSMTGSKKKAGKKKQKKAQPLAGAFEVEKDDKPKVTLVGGLSMRADGRTDADEEKKHLVIPLKQTQWRTDGSNDRIRNALLHGTDESHAAGGQGGDDSKVASTPEELEKARKLLEQQPLLLRNRVPGIDRYASDEAKLHHELKMRPEAPDHDTYERVPVEDFGRAMLLGMNWDPNTGIGRVRQKVDVSVAKPRPDRLGLGASYDELQKKLDKGKKKHSRPRHARPGDELLVEKRDFSKEYRGESSSTSASVDDRDTRSEQSDASSAKSKSQRLSSSRSSRRRSSRSRSRRRERRSTSHEDRSDRRRRRERSRDRDRSRSRDRRSRRR
ncbi:MAG: hypothetical protein MHM6MM_004857 [Cercozoa sp. M6MM]